MTEYKHTPGPWKISTDYVAVQKGRADIVAWADQGSPIARCVCGTLTSPQQPQESIANARLIAAAPELLEACKMALVQVRQDNDERKAEHRLTQSQLEAAISKAEGNL